MKKTMMAILLLLLPGSAHSEPDTLLVEPKKQTSTIQYDGHLLAANIIEIQSPANVTLVKSHVNFGDKVTQHQLLFEFASSELEMQLSEAHLATLENQEALLKLKEWSKSYETLQAMANLEKTAHELERSKTRFVQTKQLYQKGIVAKDECLSDERMYKDSQQYYESAKRQLAQVQDKASNSAVHLATLKLEQAQIKEANLQQKVALLTVRSPIAGTLLAPIKSAENKQALPFYPKKSFALQEVIASVASLDTLCINIKVDEFDIVRLHKGQAANIEFAAFPNQVLQGVIVDIANQTNVAAKENHQPTVFDVKVALNTITPKIKDKLLIGMSATVSLQENLPEGLWISKRAVCYDNNEPYVVKLVQERQVKQKVVLGDNAKNEVLVLSGLVQGEKVAIHG